VREAINAFNDVFFAEGKAASILRVFPIPDKERVKKRREQRLPTFFPDRHCLSQSDADLADSRLHFPTKANAFANRCGWQEKISVASFC
jgi:hypothetical protein